MSVGNLLETFKRVLILKFLFFASFQKKIGSIYSLLKSIVNILYTLRNVLQDFRLFHTLFN